jgi:hypothetical protein
MTTFYYIAKSGPTRIKSVEAENYGEVEALPDLSDWRCPGLNGEDGNMSPSAVPILDFALTPGTVVSQGALESIPCGIVRRIICDMPPNFDIRLQWEPAAGGTIDLRGGMEFGAGGSRLFTVQSSDASGVPVPSERP